MEDHNRNIKKGEVGMDARLKLSPMSWKTSAISWSAHARTKTWGSICFKPTLQNEKRYTLYETQNEWESRQKPWEKATKNSSCKETRKRRYINRRNVFLPGFN